MINTGDMNTMEIRSRYGKHAEYLSLAVDCIDLQFGEVERIPGFSLPKREPRGTMVEKRLHLYQARKCWLCAGARASVDAEDCRVSGCTYDIDPLKPQNFYWRA